ncbi:TfoX/Sxy family protein [Limnoglobus roseus]|uniref:RNA methyltransferase n=1 Tax=Limnoglobus roseus TaxID=2598579 RepID=A0A5C1AES9_9BACT|nr:TfoX/Sxy family protein [Limnoglobus roseus]QEL17811.1 RNA methyltransferase [Limnoglobus roseus]
MAFSETLARRTRVVLARRKNVEEKRMFGGVGFLLNGHLLVAVRKDSLLVRLGPEEGQWALSEPHATAFEITGRGTMAGWVVVGIEGVGGDDELNDWIRRAVNFVTTLPAKRKDE